MSGGTHRAVALFSGGLDSCLAARLVRDQGVEVLALHFTNAFHSEYRGGGLPERVARCAEEVGVPVEVEDVTEELVGLVKSPIHGHGSHLNPCVDCRIMSLRRAGEYAGRVGAEFYVTGEVVGQRPMSQRPDALATIEREAGLRGWVLRPLSAGRLPPTEPERLGWVDRSGLLSLRGRGRREQIALAEQLGIASYGTPAGGCYLAEASFSAKVRDLVDHGDLSADNARLIREGRCYRAPGGELVVVGRDREENGRLAALVLPGDEVLSARESSPVTVVRPGGSPAARELAARITARHCKARGLPRVEILHGPALEEWTGSIVVAPGGDDLLESVRIGGG